MDAWAAKYMCCSVSSAPVVLSLWRSQWSSHIENIIPENIFYYYSSFLVLLQARFDVHRTFERILARSRGRSWIRITWWLNLPQGLCICRTYRRSICCMIKRCTPNWCNPNWWRSRFSYGLDFKRPYFTDKKVEPAEGTLEPSTNFRPELLRSFSLSISPPCTPGVCSYLMLVPT